jgi:hypothetical protein
MTLGGYMAQLVAFVRPVEATLMKLNWPSACYFVLFLFGVQSSLNESFRLLQYI